MLTEVRWILLACMPLLPVTAHADAGCSWDPQRDMAPCLQQAIDSAAGKPLNVPPGHWQLGRALRLAVGTVLRGAPGATFVPTPGNTSNPMLLEANHVRFVQVSDLAFNGGGAGFSNSAPAIAVINSSEITFREIVVADVPGIGMLIEGGTSHGGVINSVFRNVGNRWKVTHERRGRHQGLVFCCGIGNHNNYAISNHFFDIGLDALQLSNQTGFRALKNSFELENGQRAAISSPDYPAAIFAPDSTSATISGNVIDGAQGNGIDAPGLQNSVLSANRISNSGGAGIGLYVSYDGKQAPQNVTVSGNQLKNNARWPGARNHGGIVVVHRDGNVVKLSNNQGGAS